MFVGKRLFPDEKFEKDTIIVGKTEIVFAWGRYVNHQHYNTRAKKVSNTLSTQYKHDDDSLVENYNKKATY